MGDSVAKAKVKRNPSFTDVCYSFIGILVENPNAVFALTEQRVAERMTANGWLTKREIKVPRVAGKYEYEATVVNFVPTTDGLERYNELRKLVDLSADLQKIHKAVRGEDRKERLKKKLLS